MDPELAALEEGAIPESKPELLARIQRARAALEAAVVPLDGAVLSELRRDGWALKDHLAHLAAWDSMIAARLRDGGDHEVVGMDYATYVTKDADALNEVIYAMHRDRPVAEVRALFASAHAAMLDVLQSTTEERLRQPHWDDDPTQRTSMEKVSVDTYQHYIEHQGWIEEMTPERRA